MYENEIRLGKCYLARLSNGETPVRLERNDPDGGWIARSLEHGRKVRIKDNSQLLGVYDKKAVHEIASGTMPNRRSQVTGTVLLPPPTRIDPSEPFRRPVLIRPKREPVEKRIVLVRLNLLDAAHRVLCETKKPMTTREIVAVCMQKEYWTSGAATPWQSLNAALNREIAAHGEQSRFEKKSRGFYVAR